MAPAIRAGGVAHPGSGAHNARPRIARALHPVSSIPALLRPRGILVLTAILVIGLGASAGFFRWAARDVAQGVLGELAARPSVPEEQVDLWLAYGEPQIHNRLVGLRFSSALPALVTHVSEPAAPGGAPTVYGVDLAGGRPARVERHGLRVVVTLGAPQELARAPLTGEAADRVPRAAAGIGPDAGRPFAQGVLEWALEPLIGALPRDIEGASLSVVLADEPFEPYVAGPSRPAPARGRGGATRLVLTLGVLLTLFLVLALAARHGRRAAAAQDLAALGRTPRP